MVSNKMIHYERILATRDFLKDKVDANGFRGCVSFFRELNNIEEVFKECLSLDKQNGDPSPSTKSWNTAFNNYFNGIKFLGSKMEGRKDEYHATITEQSEYEIRQQMTTLFLFYLSNKRVFKPTVELCRALNNTKNTTIFKEIKLPYHTICVEFPRGMYKMQVRHSNCEVKHTMEALESAYIYIAKGMVVISSNVLPSNASYTIGQYSATYTFKISGNDNVDAILNQENKYNNSMSRDSMKTLLNIITYISCTNAHIEKISPPKSGKINKKRFEKNPGRTKSRLPYYIIGNDIQISSNKPSSDGESAGTGRSLQTRHTVRGHYHHFWKIRTEEITDNMVVKVNEDGKVLVRKWIAPYWKGPEYGDVVLKNYKVTI